MRVLGIDPGLRCLGWGVIGTQSGRLIHVGNGNCRSEGSDLSERLLSLYRQLSGIVIQYGPDAVAIEKTFVGKDGAAALKLGQARGIALLVPAKAGLPIGEYAPNTIKKTVAGAGHADKKQMNRMVKMQLPGAEIAGPDAADALAIAICHAFHSQTHRRLAVGQVRMGA